MDCFASLAKTGWALFLKYFKPSNNGTKLRRIVSRLPTVSSNGIGRNGRCELAMTRWVLHEPVTPAYGNPAAACPYSICTNRTSPGAAGTSRITNGAVSAWVTMDPGAGARMR